MMKKKTNVASTETPKNEAEQKEELTNTPAKKTIMTMPKKKKIILICALAACAVALIVGITVGCVSCSNQGKKHNWDWDWDADGHWQYCIDDGCEEKTEKKPHVDTDSDEKCDECGASLKKEEPPAPQPPVEETETATIYFHKPADFGDKVYAHAYYHDSESDSDKNLTGDWKTYEVTTVEDDWYTIEIKHPKGLLEDGSFNLMIVPEEGSSIDVTINASEMWVNANGNLFASKAEAEADEALEKVEYAIYYYAPDWADGEKVYVYTYNGPSVGGYNTEMTADGEDGWYKLTFKTTQEFTGFGIIFHTEDESITKHEFGITITEELLAGKAFYFVDNGDVVYANKEDAETAYANPVEEPEYNETATIHFHKPADFGDKVWAHAYYNNGTSDKNLTGAWMSYEVTTVVDGWYTIIVKHPDNLFETSSFNLMIIPEEGDAISVTINAAEMWVNANGNLFASKEEAIADEAADKTEYTIYVYAPDWKDGEAVYIHTYGDIQFTNYETTTMTADTNGWYKISFETTLQLSEFHYMLHTADDGIRTDTYVSLEGLEGTNIYVIYSTASDGSYYATKEAAEVAYRTPALEPEYNETATIHFHKPADFGDKVWAHAYYNDGTSDKNLTGDWKTYEVTTVADGWYTITVKHPDGLLEDGSFNLMIIPEEGDAISVTINAAEMWVNANGNLFATKAEAEADEEAEKTEYAIYYYAPDWADGETVYVYTYDGPVVGEYNTEMPAEQGSDGWYKITFETTLELTEFHVMFHTLDDKTVKRDLVVTVTDALLEGKAFYLIDNGERVYANKTDAEAAYEENAQQVVDPVEKQTVTIYYHGTGEVSVHAYYYTDATTTVNITDWNTKPSMTADTVNTGWLKVNLEIPSNIFDDYTNFTAMIVGVAGGDKYVTISAAETWISAKGNPFATKALAEADDHIHEFGTSYECEEDGVANPTYHWQVCASCGEKSAYELHEYEGDSNVCTKCGYEKPSSTHEHIWSEEYDTSVPGFHTQTCTVEDCTETKTEAHVHEKLSHVCTVCGHDDDAGLVRIYVNIDTVGFTSPTGKYYIYAWGAAGGDGVDGNSVLGGWPGLELDYDEGDGWYSGAIAINPNYLNGGHPQINSDNGDDDRWNCDFMFSGLSDDVTEYFFDRATACSTTNPYNLEEVTFRINVDKSQLTAGSTYYIYAHYNASDSIFGGWNASELTKENPADETDNWYTITINISKTYTGTCNIMVHTEVDGQQYDAMTITATNGNWSSNSPDMVITKANA